MKALLALLLFASTSNCWPNFQFGSPLDIALDKSLRNSFLYTVAGLKPMSMEIYSNPDKTHRALFRLLNKERFTGKLKNPNLGYFVIDQKTKGGTLGFLFVYNRSALEKLRINAGLMKHLHALGFSAEDSIDLMVQKFESILRKNYSDLLSKKNPNQIYEFYLLEGLFFGYSPTAVLAFAERARAESTAKSDEERMKALKTFYPEGSSIIKAGGTAVYVSPKGASSEYDLWYSDTAKEIESIYSKLREQGLSAHIILNHQNLLLISS